MATILPNAGTKRPRTVHPTQNGFRAILRGEDVEEQFVDSLVVTQFGIDKNQGARDDAHRVRMERKVVLLRQMKNTVQIDRIALNTPGCASRM